MRTHYHRRNKLRLFIELSKENLQDPADFIWTLIVTKKKAKVRNQGQRYKLSPYVTPYGRPGWLFGAWPVAARAREDPSIRAQLMIAKVTDLENLERVILATPLLQGHAGWGHRQWVRDVISNLEIDGTSLGTRQTNWTIITNAATQFVTQCDQLGLYGVVLDQRTRVPTCDLVGGAEGFWT